MPFSLRRFWIRFHAFSGSKFAASPHGGDCLSDGSPAACSLFSTWPGVLVSCSIASPSRSQPSRISQPGRLNQVAVLAEQAQRLITATRAPIDLIRHQPARADTRNTFGGGSNPGRATTRVHHLIEIRAIP